jgi:hypothetical protein
VSRLWEGVDVFDAWILGHVSWEMKMMIDTAHCHMKVKNDIWLVTDPRWSMIFDYWAMWFGVPPTFQLYMPRSLIKR